MIIYPLHGFMYLLYSNIDFPLFLRTLIYDNYPEDYVFNILFYDKIISYRL